MAKFRQPAAQHNHFWIEDIDDMGEATGEAVLVAHQAGLGLRVAGLARFNNVFRVESLARDPSVVCSKGWA